MTVESYGTRPDLLPGAVQAAVRSGIAGAALLDRQRSREFERDSLGRFEVSDGSQLSWAGVPGAGSSLWHDEADGVREVDSILQSSPVQSDGWLVLFWDNLLIPSVQLPRPVVLECLPDIFEEAGGFWIFDPDSRFLVDCRVDGRIFFGLVPGS